jgi:AcrR family transcriptional regulator
MQDDPLCTRAGSIPSKTTWEQKAAGARLTGRLVRKPSQSAERRPRADALRNRESILGAAKEAFTRHGAEARQAGVGPGTLYRHFPTREALIEAVYRSKVEKLATAARTLAANMAPVEALRTWILLLVDHIAAKQIIAPALNRVARGTSKLYAGARGQIQGAIDALVLRGIRSGDLRRDLDASDLLRALIGVSRAAADSGWQPSAKRLVDILIAGASSVK